jgi:hypothetical protein
MSTSNFVPKIWAATILRTLEDNLVAKKICNTQYTGQISKQGDAVYFDGLADPTISSYTGEKITYENLQDSRTTLIVDQADMFAFKVGDIEKIQAALDLKGSQAQRAAYGLKKACDTYIMGLYTQAGKTVTAATITTANVLSVIGDFQQKLAESNVPESDMWMVVPPWLKLKLTLAGVKFQISNGVNGKGSMAWTNELGFDMYVTNQVVNTGTADTPVSKIMAGSKNAIAFANQITDTEDIRLVDYFETAVRGLNTYGAKVIKPLELVSGSLTYGVETTI